jgi:hypothetical protein
VPELEQEPAAVCHDGPPSWRERNITSTLRAASKLFVAASPGPISQLHGHPVKTTENDNVSHRGAAAHEVPRSGLNKSEREPTSDRSIRCENGRLIQASPDSGRISSYLLSPQMVEVAVVVHWSPT